MLHVFNHRLIKLLVGNYHVQSPLLVIEHPSKTERTFQYQTTMEEGDTDSPTTDRSTAPKLRTFGGWKRDTGHLDKSRLTKGLMRSHVNPNDFVH